MPLVDSDVISLLVVCKYIGLLFLTGGLVEHVELVRLGIFVGDALDVPYLGLCLMVNLMSPSSVYVLKFCEDLPAPGSCPRCFTMKFVLTRRFNIGKARPG